MTGLESRTFDAPDEKRMFEDKGFVEVVNVAGKPVIRGTFEPGWRWSTNVKPIAGTPSCMTAHLGYVVSGRMRIMMDDGASTEVGPGEVLSIAPGHDAEVVGDDPCVMVDFGEIAAYARRA